MTKVITYDGEVRFSLKEYNEMRDEIKSLRERNDNLTEILDHVCEENKVRVRRQIIKESILTHNLHDLGTREIIEDKLVNMEDITQEIDAKIKECEMGWMKKVDELQRNLDRSEKSLEQCQRQKFGVEQELARLKNRGWWKRLWNK